MLKKTLHAFWKLQNKCQALIFGQNVKLSAKQKDLMVKLGIDPCSIKSHAEAIKKVDDAILEKKTKQVQAVKNQTPQRPIPDPP
ncbi:MAG: hypothetical protein HQL69_19980, partial [Magnetococcales bacterium]|nr:hypothetical protein [Magnetococcales bacterium]